MVSTLHSSSPSPSLSASSPHSPPDLEAQPRHPHHHERTYPEAELSNSAVVWDEGLREWRSHDEAERDSDVTTVGGGGGGPRAATETTTPGEKGVPGEVVGEKGAQSADSKVIWVEWDGEADPMNPFNWSDRKKWTTCLLCCFFTFLVAYCGTAFGQGSGSMIRELGCSEELATLGLSIFPLGFGLGPLFTAPLSEAYGRYPLYVISALFYLIFFIPIAYGQNIATVIICRFIQGVAASTGSTLVGGTVADLFDSHNRGLGMAVFSISAFLGTGLGPAVSGYIELKKGWRWIEWVQMMFAGLLAVGIIFFTRETRGSVILSRRAKKLRKETGSDLYQCRSDAERASLAVLLKVSMTRPLYLLGTESIVFFFSLWAGFSWGCLYLLVEAIPLIFSNQYSFNIGEVGLVFYSVIVATFAGFLTTYFLQEKLYQKNVARRGPEARLYASLIGGLVFPAGAFILAFSQGRGHWFGPVVGVFLIFYGVYTIYLAVFTYLADCYTIYASSALSGQSLCRNLAAFSFPLFTRQMYKGLGYQWASFLAGMLALALSMTPFVLMKFGPSIRAKSKFAKELARMQAAKA
ncbi:MFS transporter [Sporobolomyces salmoneus]|uniref:MFS transporter n=1 Tax=Sporobolomyces salmoneus TaxID=183962 RepID=UPI0031744A0E